MSDWLASTRPPETAANMAIVLIKQNDYLLARQLKALEAAFLEHGGIRERMHAARTASRAADCEKALYSALSLAANPEDLARRAAALHSAIASAARSISRRRSWPLPQKPPVP